MTKEKLDKIFGTIAFLVIILAVVVAFTSNKLSLMINFWQAGLNNGKYYPVFTVLLIALPFLVILLPIKILLLKKSKTNLENPNSTKGKLK